MGRPFLGVDAEEQKPQAWRLEVSGTPSRAGPGQTRDPEKRGRPREAGHPGGLGPLTRPGPGTSPATEGSSRSGDPPSPRLHRPDPRGSSRPRFASQAPLGLPWAPTSSGSSPQTCLEVLRMTNPGLPLHPGVARRGLLSLRGKARR